MEASLSKTRLDIEKVRQDIQLDNRRFAISAVTAGIALLSTGIALGGVAVAWISAHDALRAAQAAKAITAAPPQVIYIQPPAK